MRIYFYSRNNICCHTIAVAWKTGTLSKVLETYMGRNTYSMSTSTVSSSVGKKKPAAGFKQKNITGDVETRQTGYDYISISNSSSAFSVQSVNPTKVVIRKPVRPEDPPPVSPLLMKSITGNIRKCRAVPNLCQPEWRGSGATTMNFYDAYYHWNKDSKSYQLSSGLRHYHINPVYAQMFRTRNKTIPLGANTTPTDGICQIAAQCFGTTLS